MRNRLLVMGLTFLVGAGATFALPAIARAGSTAPTYGRIPDAAFTESGINRALAPDFVEALDRDGAVVGYVEAAELLKPQLPKNMPVRDRQGRVVGTMVPGYGFVANGRSTSEMTPFEVRILTPPTP